MADRMTGKLKTCDYGTRNPEKVGKQKCKIRLGDGKTKATINVEFQTPRSTNKPDQMFACPLCTHARVADDRKYFAVDLLQLHLQELTATM
jgi:uncharacterized protein YlaI